KNEVIYVWHHSEDKDPNHYPNDFLGNNSNNLSVKGSFLRFVHCNYQIIMENGSDLQHLHYVHQELIPYMASLKCSFDSTKDTETENTITSRFTIYLLGIELITFPVKLCHVSPVTELVYFGTEDSMLGTVLLLVTAVPLHHGETLIDSDAIIWLNRRKPKRPILTRNDEAIVSIITITNGRNFPMPASDIQCVTDPHFGVRTGPVGLHHFSSKHHAHEPALLDVIIIGANGVIQGIRGQHIGFPVVCGHMQSVTGTINSGQQLIAHAVHLTANGVHFGHPAIHIAVRGLQMIV
ncbi:unnamed protein product, partial [Medioppia subpectinata]